MPPVDGYQLLPPEIRAWLDQELRRRGFGDYQTLSVELARRLAAAGWSGPAPSTATVGRWGQRRKRAMEATLRVAELLTALHDSAPDQAAKRTSGLGILIQDRIVSLMYQLEELEIESQAAGDDDGPDPIEVGKLLAKLGSTIAQMQRSEIAQRQHQAEVERVAVEAAADRAAAAATRRGLSADTVADLRREILGIG